MSNTMVEKSRVSWTQLDKQLIQAKNLMRQMRQTVEDIEDARIIERAKRAHGQKSRIPWSEVKKGTRARLTSPTITKMAKTIPNAASQWSNVAASA